MSGFQEYTWGFYVGDCCGWFISTGECNHLSDEEHDKLSDKVDAMDNLLEDYTIVRWEDIMLPNKIQYRNCQCCGEEQESMYTVTAVIRENA